MRVYQNGHPEDVLANDWVGSIAVINLWCIHACDTNVYRLSSEVYKRSKPAHERASKTAPLDDVGTRLNLNGQRHPMLGMWYSRKLSASPTLSPESWQVNTYTVASAPRMEKYPPRNDPLHPSPAGQDVRCHPLRRPDPH